MTEADNEEHRQRRAPIPLENMKSPSELLHLTQLYTRNPSYQPTLVQRQNPPSAGYHQQNFIPKAKLQVRGESLQHGTIVAARQIPANVRPDNQLLNNVAASKNRSLTMMTTTNQTSTSKAGTRHPLQVDQRNQSQIWSFERYPDLQDFVGVDVREDVTLEHIPFNINLCAENPYQKAFDEKFNDFIASFYDQKKPDKGAAFRHEVSSKFLNLVNDSSERDSRSELKGHFQCPHLGCGRVFAWEWALKEHLEKHKLNQKRRDFVCNTCGKGFFTKSCLKSHMKIHTRKPNSYKCNYAGCSKTYSTSEGLRLHIRNHHQVDKRWVCPAEGCKKSFVRQSDMRLHIMRIHAKTRPHPCRYEGCKKSFACYSELRRHEASHARKLRKQEAAKKKRMIA